MSLRIMGRQECLPHQVATKRSYTRAEVARAATGGKIGLICEASVYAATRSSDSRGKTSNKPPRVALTIRTSLALAILWTARYWPQSEM